MKDYDKMIKKDLLKEAKEAGLSLNNSNTKAELIQALKAKAAPPPAPEKKRVWNSQLFRFELK